MRPWVDFVVQVLSFTLGCLLVPLCKNVARRWKSWVVLVIYQAPLEGDDVTPKQYIFYLRKNKEVRGDESLAQKFWTEHGAKTAGALLKLSGEIENVQDTYLGRNSFRFLEIRIERISGL